MATALEVEQERRTTPVELLWDLVFVFAVTQVTTLLSRDLTWAGFGRSMLVLALVWWSWSAFVWAANAQARAHPRCGLACCSRAPSSSSPGSRCRTPSAVRGRCSRAPTVRLLHLALYADASRRGNASWSAIAGFALTVVVGMARLVGGSFTGGLTRVGLWTLAVAIDYAGPAWLPRERLRGLQRVAIAHFAA